MALIKASHRTKREACKRCGDEGPFYWAKDTTTNHFVLIVQNAQTDSDAAKKGDVVPDSARHMCTKGDQASAQDTQDAVTPTPYPTPEERDEVFAVAAALTPDLQTDADRAYYEQVKAEPSEVPASAPSELEALKSLLTSIVGAPKIDRAEVERIARDVVAGVVMPTKTVVVRAGERREISGLTHKSLARVIAALSVGEDVMLVGPAGTGKSKMAQQAAEGLGLTYYLPPSLTAQTGEAKFTGFVDANGTYHGTKAYEWASNGSGGIYILDELDNGNPNINGWWNSVLANREVSFPNGEVFKLTDNHRVVATANTYGFGRTREFVGRNPIDTATKNRFAVITVLIDTDLETALVGATGVKPQTAEKILGYAARLRKASDATGVNVILSPRNTVGMARLLTSDAYDWDMAVEDRLRDGVDADTWKKLTDAAGRA